MMNNYFKSFFFILELVLCLYLTSLTLTFFFFCCFIMIKLYLSYNMVDMHGKLKCSTYGRSKHRRLHPAD